MGSKKLSANGSWTQFRAVLEVLEDFDTRGSLYGRAQNFASSKGMLSENWRISLQTVEDWGELEYVVYSDGTPIAWCASGEWTMTHEKHSATTTRHQSRIYTAISQL